MAPRYNSPPNWPPPPAGWTPPPGWLPDPSWGPAPQGWQLWVEDPVGVSTDIPEPSSGIPESNLSSAGPVAGEPKAKSWFARHKILTGVGALVVLVAFIAALNGGGDEDPASSVAGPAATQNAQDAEEAAAAVASEEEAEAERLAEDEAEAAAAEEDRLAEAQRLADEAIAAEATAAEAARIGTVAQQNAWQSAVSYLDYAAFSRSGLAGQLEFEGYSPADAEFAIARLETEGGVDWNAQAVASAASYLDYTSFSRAGLIDQLVYEGFTVEQAEHGASTAGL